MFLRRPRKDGAEPGILLSPLCFTTTRQVGFCENVSKEDKGGRLVNSQHVFNADKQQKLHRRISLNYLLMLLQLIRLFLMLPRRRLSVRLVNEYLQNSIVTMLNFIYTIALQRSQLIYMTLQSLLCQFYISVVKPKSLKCFPDEAEIVLRVKKKIYYN